MWPIVEDARLTSGELARGFYDSERERMTGSIDRHDLYVADYRYEWFVEDIADSVDRLSGDYTVVTDNGAELTSRTGKNAGAGVLAEVMKIVDDGGRETVAKAVEDDPLALGWARIAGGSESCSFCTILISRGPVYADSEAAGAMKAYHRYCDCRSVPVFNRDQWPGRDQYLEAEQQYVQASKDAKEAGVSVETMLRRKIEGRA
ncbi:MAG: hypothetical protein BGP03_10200 [Pseudonocardia sp. 73-21]|nr:MAG: hypothetical protein BGP03_10200 [Pseudonocardia sp. 73-21]